MMYRAATILGYIHINYHPPRLKTHMEIPETLALILSTTTVLPLLKLWVPVIKAEVALNTPFNLFYFYFSKE